MSNIAWSSGSHVLNNTIIIQCIYIAQMPENKQTNKHLRTMPTKYKGFCERLGKAEKVDLRKGYWNSQRKTGVATHFFEIIS